MTVHRGKAGRATSKASKMTMTRGATIKQPSWWLGLRTEPSQVEQQQQACHNRSCTSKANECK